MAHKRDISESLQRLSQAEQEFLRRDILAPVVRGGEIQVKIDGVRMQMRINPHDFVGFGIFRPVSYQECNLVRPASATERRHYLELFCRVKLILCGKEQEQWNAIPASQSDSRFDFVGLIPVNLSEEAELLDTIDARFDGSRFWFDAVDARSDPSIPAYLRQSLTQMLGPDQLSHRALTAEQRIAYTICYRQRVQCLLADARYRGELRLREALAHAGAILRDFAERANGYAVTYEVDGQRHTSFVSNDLSVQSAGICLSGQDQHFDLASLVGVWREAGNSGGA